jgi:hypothetical protein
MRGDGMYLPGLARLLALPGFLPDTPLTLRHRGDVSPGVEGRVMFRVPYPCLKDLALL